MGIYTMKDWERDGSLRVKEGQLVEESIIEELADCVPPQTYSRGTFQVGEPYDHCNGKPRYQTFKRRETGWEYVGVRY